MKEIISDKILLYNPETGKHESVTAIRGESAYEAAVRLGYTTLTEEQWLKEYDTKRDAAITAIEAKGEETLENIPDDYSELAEQVGRLSEEIATVKQLVLEEIETAQSSYSGYYCEISPLCPGKVYGIKVNTDAGEECVLQAGTSSNLADMVDTIASRDFLHAPLVFCYAPTGEYTFLRLATQDNQAVNWSVTVYNVVGSAEAYRKAEEAYSKAAEVEKNAIVAVSEKTSQLFDKNNPSNVPYYVRDDLVIAQMPTNTTWVIPVESNKRYVAYITETLTDAVIKVSTTSAYPAIGSNALRTVFNIKSATAREIITTSEEKYLVIEFRINTTIEDDKQKFGLEQIDSGFAYKNDSYGYGKALPSGVQVSADSVSTEAARKIVEKATVKNDTKWKDKTIWWCGTSIPAGFDEALNSPSSGKAYPILVGELLGAHVINVSMGSSMCRANTRTGDYTNAMSHNIIRCLAQTTAEKQDMIDNWGTYRQKFNDPNTTVSLSESDKREALSATFEKKLMPYLDGTYSMPDLFVFDHGHNDWKTFYTGSDGKPDTCLEPTVANIASGELAEDTHMTENNNANLIKFFGEVDKIPSSKKAEFIASVNRNCFKGAINFLVTLILSKNPRARICFIGNLDNWEKPEVQKAQIDIAESWEFPLIKVWEKTGFSYHYIPNTSKLWDENGTQDLDMKRVYCRDNVHPHSDTTGMAMKNYSEIIADGINHIVV